MKPLHSVVSRRVYQTLNLPLPMLQSQIRNLYQTKFYTKILDHDGNVLIDNTTPESHTVIKDTTAWLLTSAMEDVMTSGTGTSAYFGSSMAQAGKSGTTTSSRDALFAGYTPYYTCAVWGATMIMPCRKVPIQTIQNVSGKLL